MSNLWFFSVDVEEWWSVHSFRHYVTPEMAASFDDRIDVGLDKILKLLSQFNATGTFFLLGRVVEKHPQIIDKILKQGSDMGTHGYAHKLIYDQTPAEFEEDLIKSKEIIFKYSGINVNKYRAPSYSITNKTLWALPILSRNGITIDSSISPAANNRFGIKNAPEQAYFIEFENKEKLLEIPPNIVHFPGIKLPVGSGFFFRFFPVHFTNSNLQKASKKNIKPIIIVHNWEFDPQHPKINAGVKAKLIHYTNISNTERKLKKILAEKSFCAINENLSSGKNIPLVHFKNLTA